MTSSFWLGACRLIAGVVTDLLMFSGALAWLVVAALALGPGADFRVVPRGAMIQTPSGAPGAPPSRSPPRLPGAAPVRSPPPCQGASLR